MERDALPRSMSRPLTLVLALAPLATVAAVGTEAPTASQIFQKLTRLHGPAYRRARDGLLRHPKAHAFLKSCVEQDPQDWLAHALYQHFASPKLRAAFEGRLARGVRDPYVDAGESVDDDAFDLARLDELLRSAPSFLRPSDPSIVPFDWSATAALQLEFVLRNPRGLSRTSRLWLLLSGFFHPQPELGTPLSKDHLAAYWRGMAVSRRHRRRVQVDPERIGAWVRAVLHADEPPVVRLPMAVNLPGDESRDVLVKLSKHNGAVGALAALLCAGRPAWASRHPFNGMWREQWVKAATRPQLVAADRVFAGNDPKSHGRWGHVEQMNERLNIPTSVAGLLLRHRRGLLGPKLARVFGEAMRTDFQTVRNCFVQDPPRGLSHEEVIAFAEDYLRSHVAWPKSYAAELAKIRTKSPKARAMIQKAIATIRARAHEYPSGADLQAAYGPPPSRKDK